MLVLFHSIYNFFLTTPFITQGPFQNLSIMGAVIILCPKVGGHSVYPGGTDRSNALLCLSGVLAGAPLHIQRGGGF